MNIDEFDSLAKQHPRMSQDTIGMVKAVLIDSRSPSEVSRAFNVSRQHVTQSVKSFQRIPLTRMWIAVPADKVQKVKDFILKLTGCG